MHGQFGVASIKFKGVASIVFHAALVDIHGGRAQHLKRIVAIEFHIDGVERHRTRPSRMEALIAIGREVPSVAVQRGVVSSNVNAVKRVSSEFKLENSSDALSP